MSVCTCRCSLFEECGCTCVCKLQYCCEPGEAEEAEPEREYLDEPPCVCHEGYGGEGPDHAAGECCDVEQGEYADCPVAVSAAEVEEHRVDDLCEGGVDDLGEHAVAGEGDVCDEVYVLAGLGEAQVQGHAEQERPAEHEEAREERAGMGNAQ